MTRLATNRGAGWTVEDPTGGAQGTTVGLAVDSSGAPHVFYWVHSSGDLMHAQRSESGWTQELVANVADDDVFAATIDGDDALVVVGPGQFLRKPVGGTWVKVATSALADRNYPSIFLDATGTLHVACYSIQPPYPSGTSSAKVYYASYR